MKRNPGLWRHPVLWLTLVCGLVVAVSPGVAQESQRRQRAPGLPAIEVPDEIILNTHAIKEIRVVVVTRGLSHPWSFAFLPDGDILITERQGRLRIIRDGVLDPEPIEGVPTDVLARGLSGMMEVALHPEFEQNRLVYLTYTRQLEDRLGTVALVRGRLEG